jgi:hypothetical protein
MVVEERRCRAIAVALLTRHQSSLLNTEPPLATTSSAVRSILKGLNGHIGKSPLAERTNPVSREVPESFSGITSVGKVDYSQRCPSSFKPPRALLSRLSVTSDIKDSEHRLPHSIIDLINSDDTILDQRPLTAEQLALLTKREIISNPGDDKREVSTRRQREEVYISRASGILTARGAKRSRARERNTLD